MDQYLLRIAFGKEDCGRRAIETEGGLALHDFLYVKRVDCDEKDEQKIDPHSHPQIIILPIQPKKQQGQAVACLLSMSFHFYKCMRFNPAG